MNEAKQFGKSISFPVRISSDGRVAWSVGPQNVRESIRIILMTDLKERLLLPQFGCGLRQYLFEPNNVATRRMIQECITQSLARWEPRIAVESVAVEADPKNPTAAIVTIHYRLIANHSQERLGLTLEFSS